MQGPYAHVASEVQIANEYKSQDSLHMHNESELHPAISFKIFKGKE